MTEQTELGELVGQRVTVHLNLTTHRWTIALKPKGPKLGSVTSVTLADVTFKVSEAQRQYCVKHGARWVHAWAIGTLVAIDAPVATDGMTCVTYNPFRAPTFHVRGAEQPVMHADRVTFAEGHGWTA